MGRALLGGSGTENVELLARVLHRAAFTQRSFTRRSFYTEKLVHREDFTQSLFYTEKLLHRKGFAHRSFYTEKSLYIVVLTQRSLHTHTQKLRKSLYTQRI